jgi:hypothetical protein
LLLWTQSTSKLSLELLDLAAERWLRYTKKFGSARKIAELCNGRKISKFTNVYHLSCPNSGVDAGHP